MMITAAEAELLIEALQRAASRRESMSRFKPTSRTARVHDRTAADMRKLRARVIDYSKMHHWR
jgi:hypothetical protein